MRLDHERVQIVTHVNWKKNPIIINIGVDYMSPGQAAYPAGPVCRDPGMSVKHIINSTS